MLGRGRVVNMAGIRGLRAASAAHTRVCSFVQGNGSLVRTLGQIFPASSTARFRLQVSEDRVVTR